MTTHVLSWPAALESTTEGWGTSGCHWCVDGDDEKIPMGRSLKPGTYFGGELIKTKFLL